MSARPGRKGHHHHPRHHKHLATPSAAAPNVGLAPSDSEAETSDGGLTPLEDHDIPRLFEILQQKRTQKHEAAQRLKQTLDQMAGNPSLFEQKDLMVVATLYKQRATEVSKIDNNLTAFQHLYDTHIKDLQDRVDQRAAALKTIDSEFGTLSGEPDLLEYFTQQQADMHGLIVKAKQLLVSSIVENLGPAVYGAEVEA